MQRNSRKRNAIYAALSETTAHPGADWIYQSLKPHIPDLSLGTVYANLAAFKQEGLAVSVGTVDGKERFDANTSPHAHFVCRVCGAVLDLPGVQLPPEPPQMPGQVARCQVVWHGVCDKCLAPPPRDS